MTAVRKILLNPGPVTTTNSVKQALIVPDICHREKEFATVVATVRKGLLQVVHADDNYTAVVFAASGTGALDATISSIIPPGKKLLILNNGSYGERLMEIATAYQIPYEMVKFDFNQAPPLTSIIKLLEQEPEICTIAMVHHETSSGILNSLNEVGDLAKKYHKEFMVDAISSYAGVPIDIKKTEIDYLIATSNKCLHGMAGISFVICKRATLERHPHNARSYYFNLYKQYCALEIDDCLRFTAPVQIFYALKQALAEYFAIGEEKWIARYRENYRLLTAGLIDLGFELLIPLELSSQLLVLAQYKDSHKIIDFDTIHDKLYLQNYTIYPGKLTIPNTIRLACLGDLQPQDIANFLQALAHVLP